MVIVDVELVGEVYSSVLLFWNNDGSLHWNGDELRTLHHHDTNKLWDHPSEASTTHKSHKDLNA